MALPAHILEQLPQNLRNLEVGPANAAPAGASLSLGAPAIEALLPDGGLPRGAVIELALQGSAALGTSLALAACRSAQGEGIARGGEPPWCAFVDPSATLYAPGVAQANVRLDRLLVVRPSPVAMGRVAIRLAESQAFAVLVLDAAGTVGSEVDVSLASWTRIVRRLALSAEQSGATVLLMTDRDAKRPLPLPVAQRIELTRSARDRLSLRVAKDRRGRVSAARTVAWVRSGSCPVEPVLKAG